MSKEAKLRPVKVQELIYHLESWNKIKSVLHNDYLKIKTSVDALLYACKNHVDDNAEFDEIEQGLQKALEQYYQSVLDHAIRLLNENYRKEFVESKITLVGNSAAVEKSLLGEIDMDGWFKILLPASTKYDSVLHIPPSFQTVQLGNCAHLLEAKFPDMEHPTFSDLQSERVIPIENFELEGFHEVVHTIYTMEEEACILFPRLSETESLDSSEVSILIALRPLTRKK